MYGYIYIHTYVYKCLINLFKYLNIFLNYQLLNLSEKVLGWRKEILYCFIYFNYRKLFFSPA